MRILASALLCAAAVHAQAIDFPSRILHETRTIQIAKPADYDTGTERYPVLYLLDAEEHFAYTAPLVRYLAAHDRIPPMLVVGISSGTGEQRTRDLTPPSTSEMDQRFAAGSGGAPAFLSFLGDELIPYIERTYRTRPYRLLIGHSYGGLFGIYAMLRRAALFHGLISIDPSISWNNQAMIAEAEAFLLRTGAGQVDLHVSAAYPAGADMARFARALGGRVPAGWRARFEDMPDETHGSIPPRAIQQGLTFVFDDWHLTNLLALYDRGGIEAVHRHFREGGRRYGGYDRATSAFDVSMIVAGLIRAGRLDEAGAVLLHDRKAYPPPWNQLEAVARNYEARGERQQSLRLYKLSLEENAKNDFARRKITELSAPSPAAGK